MFVDRVRLTLSAGKGGNGTVAWRREKYIPKGGPTGGNGGPGGSIYIRASTHAHSLDSFVNTPILRAENGKPGGPNRRNGRLGKDLYLDVPCGTLVKDAKTGITLYDIQQPDQEVLLCKGGRGGVGNHFFKSPTRQAPNFATPGKAGEEQAIELELKLIADIGLVGLPNAGKSTLFSSLTNTPSKTGDYPFTTLDPILSFIEYNDFSRLYIADIPGIIEDAHNNRGLGIEFLRHIERTKTLLYVIDASNPDPLNDLLTLRNEVAAYKDNVAEKPFFTILNKTDLVAQDTIDAFKSAYPCPPETLITLSAYTGDNLQNLIARLVHS